MAIAQPPTIQPDTRRLTEDDPDYLRLHAVTVRRLDASIATFVRELHAARGNTQREGEAASRFVERHTAELRRAYEAAHTEGVRDYYGAVSGSASQRMPYVAPDADRERQLLAFYAPSVARMAAEALRTLHESRREALGEPDDGDTIRLGFPDQPRNRGKYATTGWQRSAKGRPEHGQQEERGQGGGGAKEPAGGTRRAAAGPRKARAPTAADRAKAEGMHAEAVGARGGGAKTVRTKAPPTREQIEAKAKVAAERAAVAARTKVTRLASKVGDKEAAVGRARQAHHLAWQTHQAAIDTVAWGGSPRVGGRDRIAVARETLKIRGQQLGAAQRAYTKAVAAHAAARDAAIAAGSTKIKADPRESVHQDAQGQRTPFSRADFEHALVTARPLGSNGGEIGTNASAGAISGIATIGGKSYYVKGISDPWTAGGYTKEDEAIHEVAARQLAVAAGHGERVPGEVYHFEHNGEHYVVSSLAAGKPLGDRGLDLSASRAKAFDKAIADGRAQDHLMTDYLYGRADGHSGNYLFDAKSGNVVHIDTGRDFGSHTELDKYGANEFRESLARQSGMKQSEINTAKEDARFAGAKAWTRNVSISHETIRSYTSREAQITQAAQRSGLSREDRKGVSDRLNVLHELDKVRNPTLWHWHRLSEGKSIPRADLGGGS